MGGRPSLSHKENLKNKRRRGKISRRGGKAEAKAQQHDR